MRERLERAWAERVHRAAAWRHGEDPTPVLEALAQGVVFHLVRAMDAVGDEARTALLQAGAAAIAAARETALADPSEREAWLASIALADFGRRLLAGEPEGDLPALAADRQRPSPHRVASMLDGRLDGLAAAACAVWCLEHDPDEPRLLWSLAGADEAERSASEPPILVAAAGPDEVRDPAGGTLIAHHDEAHVEAIWFAVDRQLAVYALDDVHVSLTAPGLTMRDLRPGYWLGDLAPDAPHSFDATLKIGDRTYRWRLELLQTP